MMYVQHSNQAPKQHALYVDVASDFDEGRPNYVNYQNFIQHLQY